MHGPTSAIAVDPTHQTKPQAQSWQKLHQVRLPEKFLLLWSSSFTAFSIIIAQARSIHHDRLEQQPEEKTSVARPAITHSSNKAKPSSDELRSKVSSSRFPQNQCERKRTSVGLDQSAEDASSKVFTSFSAHASVSQRASGCSQYEAISRVEGMSNKELSKKKVLILYHWRGADREMPLRAVKRLRGHFCSK